MAQREVGCPAKIRLPRLKKNLRVRLPVSICTMIDEFDSGNIDSISHVHTII